MASTNNREITHDTLALYSSLRRIHRFSHTCQHWMGEDYPIEGANHYYIFPTEGQALRWFQTGNLPDGFRPTSREIAELGCPCRQAGGSARLQVELVSA
jgi:hypothetical protein